MSFSPAGGSHLVATCGGESLCVIDCEVGMVMKKYKVPGEVCPIFFLFLGCFFLSGVKHITHSKGEKQRTIGIRLCPYIHPSSDVNIRLSIHPIIHSSTQLFK